MNNDSSLLVSRPALFCQAPLAAGGGERNGCVEVYQSADAAHPLRADCGYIPERNAGDRLPKEIICVLGWIGQPQYFSGTRFLPFRDSSSSYFPRLERLGSLTFFRGIFW